MKTSMRWLAKGLVVVTMLALSGCASGPREPTVRLTQVARDLGSGAGPWQAVEPAEVGLQVWRGDREIRAARDMLLQRGDVVQTGAQSAAVVRFSGGNTGAGTGTITLDANTRVRIGSIEVFFGRVFANIRGFFETSSENVVAGVEGTRFLFAVQRDRSVNVSVADGVVSCRPRQGGWDTVRLHANEALFSAYPNRNAPRVMPADPRELRDAANWAAAVADAPEQGWCCVDGRVVPSGSNQCTGTSFSTNRGVTELSCRPPPPERGWCCFGREVYQSTRAQCRGSFSDSADAARRACTIAGVPGPR